MSEVLILGNGISRLLHEDTIRSWPGELWGCNYAFREFGPQLTRLTGHVAVLREARAYRDQHGFAYQIWGGHLSGIDPDMHAFTCPRQFCKDSGTTLVAQAFEEGYERIRVVGFDLGGPDVLSPGIEDQNKTMWIKRWRELARHYGLARVRFVGYDHKPMIQGDFNERFYARRYQSGQPHIPGEEYARLLGERTGRPIIPVTEEEVLGKGNTMVTVEYIEGPRVGWQTQYPSGIAYKMAGKKNPEIRIVYDPDAPPAPPAPVAAAPPPADPPPEIRAAPADAAASAPADSVLAGTPANLSRVKLETLREIARLSGLEGWEDLKRPELIGWLKALKAGRG